MAAGRGTLDPLDWRDLDHVTAADWCRGLGLNVVLRRAWGPALHGMYFQDAASSSAAVVAAMAAHGVRQQTWTFDGGLSALVDALAGQLDVRYGVAVHSVAEDADGARVQTSAGPLEADVVVVALPASGLAQVAGALEDEFALSATRYSAGLLVALGVDRQLRRDELAGAYGVLNGPDDGPLAAACVASRAGHARGRGDVVTCMFGDIEARRLQEADDDSILAQARAALTLWAPSLAGHLTDRAEANLVVRVPHAMPTTPLGRLEAIADYRDRAVGRRVVAAGDSLAWPWSDSTAAVGQWAARTVMASVRDHEKGR